MATSDHRKVEVGPDDFVIISARPIPGNEKTVGNVVNELMKRGCDVVYESMYEVHVSGHACQEELKLMQGLTKPKYFIPVHGEQKHLHKHAQLAESMGIPKQNIYIGDIGGVVEINEDFMHPLAPVPAGRVLVDGLGAVSYTHLDNIFIIPHSFKQFQAIYLFLSGISGKVGEHPVVSENFNRRPPSCPEERAGRKIPGIIYPWNFLIGFSRTVHHQV